MFLKRHINQIYRVPVRRSNTKDLRHLGVFQGHRFPASPPSPSTPNPPSLKSKMKVKLVKYFTINFFPDSLRVVITEHYKCYATLTLISTSILAKKTYHFNKKFQNSNILSQNALSKTFKHFKSENHYLACVYNRSSIFLYHNFFSFQHLKYLPKM